LGDYDILPMNWDALERGIDKEDIKWTRRVWNICTGYVRDGMLKIKSNLAKYLGRPESEELARDS
jgi:hypothetical protein